MNIRVSDGPGIEIVIDTSENILEYAKCLQHTEFCAKSGGLTDIGVRDVANTRPVIQDLIFPIM
jgi:hypothetical protein